mmetsp:Transcript_37752/g.102909  ORF Transcript_37752/g.102909 Transcript_37752/m.102909 type:complete len:282 (+) Transcript_37752:367-1212(+)
MAEPGAPLEPALFPLVLQLTNPDQREAALLELSKKREAFSDLVSALLQEIISIYPMLSPPTLTAHASNRVCNALALLQCVASHQETRGLFLSAHIPLYLYPFLNTVSKNRPFEYLRLTSLGVIGALVKMDDSEVINFLLQTEIIPLCLRIMETGSELSKTVRSRGSRAEPPHDAAPPPPTTMPTPTPHPHAHPRCRSPRSLCRRSCSTRWASTTFARRRSGFMRSVRCCPTWWRFSWSSPRCDCSSTLSGATCGSRTTCGLGRRLGSACQTVSETRRSATP